MKGHTLLVASLAFSPGGRKIVSGSLDNTIRTWDAELHHHVLVLEGYTDWVSCVAVSPDNCSIVSGSGDYNSGMGHGVWRDSMRDIGTRPVSELSVSVAGREESGFCIW